MIENKYTKGVEVTVGPMPINEQGEVLLCQTRHRLDGAWVVCGGHVEPGETLAQTTVREAKEELGVDVEVLEQLCMEECFVGPPEFKRYGHSIYFTFLVKIKSGQEVKIDNDEIIAYKWMSPEDALPVVGMSYRKPIQMLIDRKS